MSVYWTRWKAGTPPKHVIAFVKEHGVDVQETVPLYGPAIPDPENEGFLLPGTRTWMTVGGRWGFREVKERDARTREDCGWRVIPNGARWVVQSREGELLRNSRGAFRWWASKKAAQKHADIHNAIQVYR